MSFVIEDRFVVNEFGEIIKSRPRVKMIFDQPSLTRQEFKADCDLGALLKKFAKTPEGRFMLANASGFAETAQFHDVSGVPEYRAAFDIINAAKAGFEALPLIVRDRFNHDPIKFMEFCENPANRDEARSLGLLKPDPAVSAGS